MTGENTTTYGLIVLVLLLACYDVLIHWCCGPQATLSRVIFKYASEYPIIAFALGVLAGHVFWKN